jgi:heme/copper-type cytochrome/quinol oxidase subunit 3
VLAMLIFVFTEIMFFTGLVSAFLITRASIGPGGWPPPNQPRLPVATTAVNTAALLISAVVLFFAWRSLRESERTATKGAASLRLGVAIALGAAFLIGQGREWVALLREGLTLHSSIHGSFFYIIVGCHGLHALVALLSMGWAFLRLRSGRLRSDTLAALSVFWYFVAGVWPFLYYQIYL